MVMWDAPDQMAEIVRSDRQGRRTNQANSLTGPI